jgi:hypothetical protein
MIRVDVFLNQFFKDSQEELCTVIKKVMCLSHGQAAVERSFSINKEVTDVNIAEHNLVCRRMIKDYLSHVGGVENVLINDEMMASVKASNLKYKIYLEDQRKAKERIKRKNTVREVEEELSNLKKKQKRLLGEKAMLLADSVKFSEKAEATGHVQFCVKGNSFRRSADRKDTELVQIDTEIKIKAKELRNM